jgi:hypothetical protein
MPDQRKHRWKRHHAGQTLKMYAFMLQFVGFVDVFSGPDDFSIIPLLMHLTKSFFGKVSFTCLFNDVHIT